MTTEKTMKGWNDYSAEELDPSLPDDTYHFAVRECVVDTWEDGRDRINISTTVVSGERKGDFGPRKTYTLGAYDGENWSETEEEAAMKLRRGIELIRNGKPLVLSVPDRYDAQMLHEIGKQIVGDEFVAPSKKDDNGFSKMGKISSMSNPPKKFKSAEVAAGFDLSDV